MDYLMVSKDDYHKISKMYSDVIDEMGLEDEIEKCEREDGFFTILDSLESGMGVKEAFEYAFDVIHGRVIEGRALDIITPSEEDIEI